jgi:hypothetical protein
MDIKEVDKRAEPSDEMDHEAVEELLDGLEATKE